MGVRKRRASPTQAHYRLRATKLRQEKRPEQLNGTEDADMGEAPELNIPLAILLKASIHPQPERDTPPTTPTHESPQSQLGSELQSHIATAVASKTVQIKTTGDEVLELVSMVSQKVIDWEKQSLQGAASLGRDIRTLVLNFSKNLTTGDPSEQENHHLLHPAHNSYAKTVGSPSTAPRTQPKLPKATCKPPQPEKPLCIFLRLSKDHPARQASPHATMDILRKHLDKTCSAAIKEIQQVPSGLAIWPKDGPGLQLLTEHRELLERLIQGATAEVEQKWAIYALPNAPQQYTSYDGPQVPVTEQMALDKFKLQTGLSPLRFYRSNKNPLSGTLVMAVPETQVQTVPKRVYLFGENIPIKHKPLQPRIEQCMRCWDYHNPRTCTHTPRCCICSKRDHTEETHSSSNDEDKTSDPYLLIQEPWIFTDRSHRISKHHPSFHQLAPIEDWSARPRVLTYIRKHPHLKAELVPFGPPSRDILAIQINTPQRTTLLVNIYNAPCGAVDEGQGLESLMAQTTPSLPCLIAGDFNLQHPIWQSSARPSPRAEPFLSWTESQDLTLTLPPDSLTQGQNMIDLSWANSALLSLGISSEVATDLPPLADHEPILTTIQWGTNDLPWDTPPLRWSTLNDELFRETIQGETRHVDWVTSTLSPHPSPAQLDELANSITQAISTALEASTKRAYPRPCGHKWWNQDCTRVVKTLRRVARDPTSTPEDIRDAKQALPRVVRHIKRQFWRSKVDEFEEPKDVFNAVKWNRTEGTLPISPLKEGDRLHTSTDDKASYLVRALLQKASCSEDVVLNLEPINNPTLPFPAITEKEIYTAVIKPPCRPAHQTPVLAFKS
ncbi:hypothetical protein SI65_02315 [Aspergillus cristatus]|uniref:Endonuclease/exonuclease/phosphatase domain-containing protein n=1 Tax=Aspergillus cristatus TaxID=573508 RepID=A0A1E3BKZ2_ASPCR|nr:hypothetical protein SI65_02315 [Aspergillus cristatus]